MEKEIKHIWVSHDEPSDTKAKIAVVITIIVCGIALFFACIYSILPALLS